MGQSETKLMNMTVFNILVIIAGGLAVVSLIKPQWPLLAVAMLLVCVALIAGK